jgi:small-conductance mechanosensitive channel
MIPSKIETIVQLEPLMVLAGLVAISLIVYQTVLRALNDDRHRLLRRLFKNLLGHVAALLFFYIAYVTLPDMKFSYYLGFLAVIWGSIVLVKVARILLFEYLFFVSMKAGVPVLLVNILSLGLSLALAGWIATEVFGVRLAPVLATSALISVILGLAIQDTLGNLFAGIALQFDKPYEIGDWVEIQNEGQKWAGRVSEISWRSTMMTGILDELITVPNRLIAQSEVAAWGAGGRPFWRAVSYRIPFDQSIEQVRAMILRSVANDPEVLQHPAPSVYLNEIGDAWLNFRLVFAIGDYGAQFRIIDKVNTAVMDTLFKSKIPVATPALRVEMVK